MLVVDEQSNENNSEMKKEKIEALKHKRLKLQEEVRQKAIRERVATQISFLEQSGEPYSVYYDSEHLNWIDSNVRTRNRDGYNGIHGDFQIDVVDAAAQNSYTIKEEEIDAEVFKHYFLECITADRLIVCYQGGDPELDIPVRAFINRPTVFFANPETWLLTTDKQWLIEYIWEQGVIRFIRVQDSNPILETVIVLGG